MRRIFEFSAYEPTVFVGRSDIDGEGLFSKSDIPAGKIICMIADLGDRDGSDNWINGYGHKVNHSSYPNSEVVVGNGKCFLKSLSEIGSGDEITTDYRNLPDEFDKTIYTI